MEAGEGRHRTWIFMRHLKWLSQPERFYTLIQGRSRQFLSGPVFKIGKK